MTHKHTTNRSKMTFNPTYLDHNASTPLKPAVKELIISSLNETGNPSSIHKQGRVLRKKIDHARAQIAEQVSAYDKKSLIFTSGATEANNLALNGLDNISTRLISNTEHPSLLFSHPDAIMIPTLENGLIDLKHLESELKKHNPDTGSILISVMLVNNETGIIQPIKKIVEIAKKYHAFVHSDAVQALGRIPLNIKELGVDMISLSAHKVGGPQGVGALVFGTCLKINPTLKGGAQENKQRAGTENTSAISAFGLAVELAVKDLSNYTSLCLPLRDRLEAQILEIAPNTKIFGKDIERVCNTSFFAAPSLSSETQLIGLDLENISISNGSACSSGTVKKSAVLEALSATEDEKNNAIRVSLGWNSTQQDIDHFLKAWKKIYDRVMLRNAI